MVADRATDAIAAAAGRSESAAAALSALLHFLDRPYVDRLRQVLGLTSSGTVRLIDRLEESGYARREAGVDGRSTSVVLTEAGQEAARRVSAARAQVLLGAMAALWPAERDGFEALISKMLVGMMRGRERPGGPAGSATSACAGERRRLPGRQCGAGALWRLKWSPEGFPRYSVIRPGQAR